MFNYLYVRPKWNRQFSYKSAAQGELQQAIDDMPPLQVFSDVLRLDRPKKSIDEDSFADIEMWKEVISRREQFDISEADIFHFFSQKAQLPASVLVGGHNSGLTNPFQVGSPLPFFFKDFVFNIDTRSTNESC